MPLPSSVQGPGYLAQPYRFSLWQHFLEYFIASLQIVFLLSPIFHPESEALEKSRFTLQPFLILALSFLVLSFKLVLVNCLCLQLLSLFSPYSLNQVIIKPGRDLLMSSSSTSCSKKARLQS